LQEYNFKIRHIKRIIHVLPHYLSYLYKLLDLNLNKKSILDISKSEDILILNINNNKDDKMAKRMKEFIVSIANCQESLNKKKKNFIRKKYNKVYIRVDLLFKSFFCNGFY
jgi:hypothetical protein